MFIMLNYMFINTLNLRNIFKILGVSLSTLVLSSVADAALLTEKPNFVLILSDD